MSNTTTADKILKFQFKECTPKQWYKKDADFEALISKSFESTFSDLLNRMMEPYQIYLEGYLAVILMLNHFTRNIFRNTPKAFSGGENGLEISLVCYEKAHGAS